MAAMHEDDSPDLKEVARILGEVLDVSHASFSFVFSYYTMIEPWFT